MSTLTVAPCPNGTKPLLGRTSGKVVPFLGRSIDHFVESGGQSEPVVGSFPKKAQHGKDRVRPLATVAPLRAVVGGRR